LLFLAAFFSTVVGLFVFSREKSSVGNIAFFGISLGIGLWAVGIAVFLLSDTHDTALKWARLYYFAPIVLVVSSVFFASFFGSKKKAPSYEWLFMVCGLFLAGLIEFDESFMIKGIVTKDYGKLVVLESQGYSMYSGYLLICFAVTIGIMCYKYLKLHDSNTRLQIRVFLVGFMLSCIAGLYFNLYLPGVSNYSLISLGPISTSFFLFAMGYAIVKHHMFDIKIFVIRAAVYSLTLLVLAIMYVAPIVYIIMMIFHVPFRVVDFVITVLIATYAATNFNRLRQWFDRRTSRFFFRDAYDPAEILSEFNKELVSSAGLTELLHKTSAILGKSLRPEHLTFVVTDRSDPRKIRVLGSLAGSFRDGYELIQRLSQTHDTTSTETVTLTVNVYKKNFKKQLTDNDIAVIARLNTDQESKKELLGCVLLGPRKSGKVYDMQDLQVLDAVANTLVIAMQNALQYEQIQNFNITLQQQVEEQTRKYRAANERLKKLDETKDEFISMASHQLRTPLTSIKGYLSMVLEGDAGKLNKQQEQMLQQSFLSSERMVNLIADLLNLSRLNTGKFVIDATPTDLRMIVDQEVSQLRETAKAKNIELTYEMPPTFTMINLDENKIHQVVMNFIDNALYYTPPGGKVTVALTETPTAIEYRVTDTGIGVPRDLQHHLFSKFYRADNARRMRPDGTGLGLYMAKKIVVAQGGSIIFKSTENVGSTFGFRFVKAHVGAMPTTVADDSTETAKR
jgi:signal transduction histidine kinase